jgi:hypothetical protein
LIKIEQESPLPQKKQAFPKISVSVNYSQHEAQSAHVAQPDEQSSQVQVVQHIFTQQDFVSATSAFCGAKLKRKKIAEKRMMDFIVDFRI